MCPRFGCPTLGGELVIADVESADVPFFAAAGLKYLPALVAEVVRNLLVGLVTWLFAFVVAPCLVGLAEVGEAGC